MIMDTMSEIKRYSTLLQPEKTALLIIDIQERILPVINKHQLVVENTIKLIKGFKVLSLPIYYTEFRNGIPKPPGISRPHRND